MGSPPRVRGKVCEKQIQPQNRGITPACAGKSKLVLGGEAEFKDHPRVCGEKNFQIFLNGIHIGSPPRVRGKGT